MASAAGGGALLGLALFDVCPELRERIDLDSEYPLAEVSKLSEKPFDHQNMHEIFLKTNKKILFQVLMIFATFMVAILDDLIQQCCVGHSHSHSSKKRLESRAELLGKIKNITYMYFYVLISKKI